MFCVHVCCIDKVSLCFEILFIFHYCGNFHYYDAYDLVYILLQQYSFNFCIHQPMFKIVTQF